MSTPMSCQAILHQPLQRRTAPHRVGHRAAEAFAFDGEHALRVRRLQRRGVETDAGAADRRVGAATKPQRQVRSEEHTSEIQSLMRISYAVFCVKKKKPII